MRGFLYQLFGSADWATSVVANTATGQVNLASLTLEPHDGADAKHVHNGRLRSIQFKSAAQGLALTAIVDRVFPDLYRAVVPEAVHQELVLQSDQAVGRIDDLSALCALLRQHPTDEALKRAQAQHLRFRLRKSKPCDARTFFQRAGATASKMRIRAFASDAAARARFADLLRRFLIDPPKTDEEMRWDLLSRLKEVLLDPIEAPATLDRLIGDLAQRASLGDQQIDVVALLEANGVPSGSLGALTAWTKQLSTALDIALDRAGYRPLEDCRESAPHEPTDKPTVFCGPSGVGKTWLMARTARRARERGDRVIWLEGPHPAGTVRERVTDAIQSARNIGARKTNPDALAGLLKRLGDPQTPIRITVCLDRFSTFAEAQQIINDPWWNTQGVRLVAAFPASDPTAVDLPAANCVTAANFNAFEVRALFGHRTQAWTSLPSDIRALLERPFLARLYADLAAGDERFRPQTEYELVGRAWEAEPRSRDHRGQWREARAILRAKLDRLVDNMLDAVPAVYPWPLLNTPCWTTPQRELLEERGLLRWASEDSLQLDHDRFLAWGIAEAIAERHRKRALTDNQLFALVAACLKDSRGGGMLPGRAVGYVALDVFWRLLAPDSAPDPEFVKGAAALSGYGDHKVDWPMWATLGARGFQLLLALSETALPSEARLTHLGRAMASAAPPLEDHHHQRIGVMLTAPDLGQQSVATAFITARPDSRHLDVVLGRAGELFRFQEGNNNHFQVWHRRRTANCEALKALAKSDPDSFVRAAQSLNDPDQAAAASFIGAELSASHGRQIWTRLRSKVDDRDRLRLDRQFLGLFPAGEVADAVAADAAGGDISLWRLAQVRPDQSIVIFAQLSDPAFANAIGRISPLGAASAPCQLRIAAAINDGSLLPEAVASDISAWSAHLDDSLARAVRDSVVDFEGATKRLSLLARAPSLKVLESLEELAGTEFEARLARHAVEGLDDDAVTSAATRIQDMVLLRIGPTGFGELIARQLAHPSPAIARLGLKNALVGDETLFLDALVEFSARAASPTASGSIPAEPFEVLAAVAPKAASEFAAGILNRGQKDDTFIAAKIAERTEDASLGERTLAALGEADKGSLLSASDLQAAFKYPASERVAIARKLLALGDSHSRAQAAWVAADLNDDELAAAVAAPLIRQISTSVDGYDRSALSYLMETAAGPSLMALFEASGTKGFLQHILMEVDAPQVREHAVTRNDAVRSAFDLDTNYHPTPREGLRRLWQIDPNVALEAYDEGLQRGGKIMGGMAGAALDADPDRAATIFLRRLPQVSEEKVRADVGRALRAHPDPQTVAPQVARQIDHPDETFALAAIELAGWLSRVDLDDALRRVLARSSHEALLAKAKESLARSDRIKFLSRLNDRLCSGAPPLEHRRLVAITMAADSDAIVRLRRDPLSLGPHLRTVREGVLFDKRLDRRET